MIESDNLRRLRTASLALVAAAITGAAIAAPPPTEREPVRDELHGETIVDDYRWLEPLESESDRVREWTTAQNDYTRSVLDGLPCRDALSVRLKELLSIGSISAPVMRGERYFYRERTGDENQARLMYREGHDGEPRLLLDPNTLDERGLYALDWFRPSHDGSTLAFGLSYAGDEMTVVHVLDVHTGTWLADRIEGKCTFGGWAPNGRGFLYSRLADPTDPYSRTIRYHEIGRSDRHDPILFAQSEPSRVPGAFLTEDGRWIVLSISDGWARNDLFVANANEALRTGEAEFVPIAEGEDATFQPFGSLGDTLFLVSSLDAPKGALWAVDMARPDMDDWKLLVAEDDTRVLEDASLALGTIVANYKQDVTTRFERFGTSGRPLGSLELPGLGSASISTASDRTEAFISYASFDQPTSIYRVDVAGGERELWERPEVPVDPSTITVTQRFATSSDGTRVPYFLVHRSDIRPDGDNPALISAYGGFNISLQPRFSATTFPWFEAGGVYAVANLRGGGEYGEEWHRAGMLGAKQNVYDDLYAVAEDLIDGGWTSPERLAVVGGSNGGLLTGVAATQRPDLFAAVVSAVPLLDMLRYHEFLMARFWVPEYGSAEDSTQFEWLRAYSPYHNVEDGRAYPAIMFTAGENDSRVHPLHARKMAALMQAKAGNDFDEDPILLWVDRDGGHGQGKPLELVLRDLVDRWSFLMWQTGACE